MLTHLKRWAYYRIIALGILAGRKVRTLVGKRSGHIGEHIVGHNSRHIISACRKMGILVSILVGIIVGILVGISMGILVGILVGISMGI